MFVSPGIPRWQMVDLRQLSDQVLIMLSLPIRGKCIQVTVRADPAALCRVDPDQMKQVLTAIGPELTTPFDFANLHCI